MPLSNAEYADSTLPRIYAWFSALVLDDVGQMAQLLAQGLSVDVTHPLRHTTALMEATRLGRTATIRWLLDQGASPAFLNGMPQGTALHCALRRKHWEIAGMLIHACTTTAVADSFGQSPLHAICMEQHDNESLVNAMDAINVIVGKGCPVDALNNDGLTALHYTVLNDCPQLLELMLVHGANPNIATPDEGATPLMIAAVEHNGRLCALLLQHGADMRQQNKHGQCAMDMYANLAKMDIHALAATDGTEVTIANHLPPHLRLN